MTSLSSAIDVVSYGNDEFLCCAEGVYRIRSGGDDKDDKMFAEWSDDDDHNAAVGAKRRKIELSTGHLVLDLAFKYKTPAVAFARTGPLLLSLHHKSDKVSFVECASLDSLRCVAPCVVKLEDSDLGTGAASPNGAHWIVALEASQIKSSGAANVFGLAAIPSTAVLVIIKISTCPPYSLLIDRALGECKSELKVGLPFHVVSKAQITNDLCSYFRGDDAIVASGPAGGYQWTQVAAIASFSQGVLLLLRSGQLWQYIRQGGEHQRLLMPVRGVALLSVSTGQGEHAVVVTTTGFVYKFSLPWKEELRKQNEKMSLNEGKVFELDQTGMFEEIVSNASALDKQNAELANLEVTLSQLRVAMLHRHAVGETNLLTCSCSTAFSAHSYGLASSCTLVAEVTNASQFDLVGRFWRLRLSLGDGGRRSLHFNSPLPAELPRGATWIVRQLIPDEFLRLESMPLAVSGALHFSCAQSNGHSIVCEFDAFSRKLDTLDFIYADSLHETAGTSELEAAGPREESFEDYVRRFSPRESSVGSSGGEAQESASRPAFYTFTTRLPSDILCSEKANSFVRAVHWLKSVQATKVTKRVDAKITLLQNFTGRFYLEAEGPEREGLNLGASFSDASAFLAFKRDVMHFVLEHKVQQLRSEPTDKQFVAINNSILTRMSELLRELECLEDQDTKENVAQLMSLYAVIRNLTDVTLNGNAH